MTQRTDNWKNGGAIVLGGATAGLAVGAGVAAARPRGSSQQSAAAPKSPRSQKVAKAAKAAGEKTVKVGKTAARGAKAAAKVTGKVVLPAAPVVADVARNHRRIAASAAQHMRAISAGEAGAKAKAFGALAKAAGPASTLVLPALAAAAAITTARDVFAKSGRLDEAAGEGAYAAGNLVLGSALSEYSKAREAGQGRASAVIEATLKGIDNRFLFGMMQRGLKSLADASESARGAREGWGILPDNPAAMPPAPPVGVPSGAPATVMTPPKPSSGQHNANANSVDPITMSIVQHEAGMGRGETLPRSYGEIGPARDQVGAVTRAKDADRKKTDAIVKAHQRQGAAVPRQLAPEQRATFAKANKEFATRQQRQTAAPERAPAKEVPKSGRKPGWGPEARIAAYKARNPSGENVPYAGDPANAEDYEPPIKSA